MKDIYLKLTLITDIHNGPNCEIKLGTRALPLLRTVTTHARKNNPDMIIDLGDRISNLSPEKDRHLLMTVADMLKSTGIPRAHLMGNHDHDNLDVATNEDILGVSMSSHVRQIRGYSLIFWQANTRNTTFNAPVLAPGDLIWLKKTLDNAPGPCLVFTHIPLDAGSMTGNFYFEKTPRLAAYDDTFKIRKVLEQSGKVVACIAGHVHWNTVNRITGITYLTLGSLTDCCHSVPDPDAAFADLEIFADDSGLERLKWQAFGQNPLTLIVNAAHPGKACYSHIVRSGPKKPLPFDPIDIRAVLFDLDGVFYTGSRALSGSSRIIDDLKTRGIPYLAVTNNSALCPGQIHRRLAGMGVDMPEKRILTAGQVVARHLVERGACPKVFVVGSDALRKVLQAQGIVLTECAEVVVIGWSDDITMGQLKTAVALIQNGADFIATNPDKTIPKQNGPEPECGSLIAFFETAAGKRPQVMGKPQACIFDMALEILGTMPSQTLMVGDTLETDILGANTYGMPSVYIRPQPCSLPDITPSIQLADLDELLRLLHGEKRLDS